MSEHEKIRGNLAALSAGALEPAEESMARAHLESCAECAREWESWQKIGRAVERLPAAQLSPQRLARIAAAAEARRQHVLERRWNRLVLAGLVLYGWALFTVSWPLLPAAIERLGGLLRLPWFAVVLVGLTLWWSFCTVIGLGLLPLLRGQKAELEEKVT
ncbi:MAG: anti-sigma factor family protein [Candidatus Acidiferrales bacterium]